MSYYEFIENFINYNYFDSIKNNYDNNEHIQSIIVDLNSMISNIYNTNDNNQKYIIINTIYYIVNNIIFKINNNNKLCKKVNDLLNLNLPEQRSQEWYNIRKTLLTASSLAAAIGHDFFKNRYELILDKIETKNTPYESNPITEWGVKYEEIATKLYESLNNLKILEFGLIPHPEFKIFGASPDGICSNDSPITHIGRMLEIKCPPKRKFTKTVPQHYWMQMQGQLECCDLNECDFLQVKICEYDNYDNYKSDTNNKHGETTNNYPKGITLTYREKNELKYSYIYPELFKSDEYYLKWMSDNKNNVINDGHEFIEAKWWYIERYECTLVKRDKKWWITTIPEIYKFWNDVEYFKNNKEELINIINNKKKRKFNNNNNKKITNSNECLI